MSPRKWSGARRESSIVIFRFSEVSKVDRCAGYGFLLVSGWATQGGVGIPCNDDADSGIDQASTLSKEKEEGCVARPGSFDFTLQRTGCPTLIFLSLLLVVPLLSSPAAPPFNGPPPVNIDADPVTLRMRKRQISKCGSALINSV